MLSQADHIIACRARWLAKLKASGRLETPRGKSKRNHPKRHSENRERSLIDRRKAARSSEAQAASNAESKRRAAIVAAYFRGELPDLSGIRSAG